MKTIIISLIGILVLIASPVQADLVELDLLALGCPTVHDFDTPQWSYDFDLGVEFSSIDHVYMDWSGEISASMVDHIGNPDPYPSVTGIESAIGSYPSYKYLYRWGGIISYPDPETFDEMTEIVEGSMPLSDLYDGSGIITISYTLPILPGTHWYVEYGSVSINKTKLIIDGNVIPEPASFLIMVLGGLMLRINKNK